MNVEANIKWISKKYLNIKQTTKISFQCRINFSSTKEGIAINIHVILQQSAIQGDALCMSHAIPSN